MKPLSSVLQAMSYRLVSLLGQKLITVLEWLIFCFTPQKSFYDLEEFPWHKTIEEKYPQILNELHTAFTNYDNIPELKIISEEQQRIVKGNKWKTLFFYAYGEKITKNCTAFPNTQQALSHIPGMVTAFYSILEPNTQLTPHRGTYAGVLRYHLALMVPKQEKDCVLVIGNETRHWQAGKSLIFDDTLEHYAQNNSNEIRVVLFVDFKRPLPFPLSALNSFLIWLIGKSPYIQKIIERV